METLLFPQHCTAQWSKQQCSWDKSSHHVSGEVSCSHHQIVVHWITLATVWFPCSITQASRADLWALRQASETGRLIAAGSSACSSLVVFDQSDHWRTACQLPTVLGTTWHRQEHNTHTHSTVHSPTHVHAHTYTHKYCTVPIITVMGNETDTINKGRMVKQSINVTHITVIYDGFDSVFTTEF